MRAAEIGADGQMAAAAEAVEQVELRRGEREPAMLVLSEEGEEPAAEHLKVGRGGGAALDEGPRAPAGPHPAREDDFITTSVVVADPVAQLGQLRLLEQAGRQLEHALHVGVAGARAHDSRPRLPAQQQVQGVREHRLARAGLPRDRRQPGAGPQLGPLDQQQVLDAQLEEHRPGVPARPDGAARQ